MLRQVRRAFSSFPIRKTFVMSVYPNQIEEYKKRHNPIWFELEHTLKEHGVLNYSIHHLEDTNQLFAFAEIECEEKWNSIAETDICKKWWKYMGDIMPSNDDSSPITKDLKEVFHICKDSAK
jgi:L-rhamnose mutarotase